MTRQKRKELLIHALRLYTLLVTLITVMMIILGNLLDRGRVFSYDAFVSPLFYALIGTVATVVTRSDRKLSVRSLIIRKGCSRSRPGRFCGLCPVAYHPVFYRQKGSGETECGSCPVSGETDACFTR